jgi:hypothetical protein
VFNHEDILVGDISLNLKVNRSMIICSNAGKNIFMSDKIIPGESM